MNGTNYFTIFDLPISVSNSIAEDSSRPSCDELNNPLLSNPLNASSAVISIPYLNGAGVDTFASTGFGNEKPLAAPEDGLGSDACMITWRESIGMLCLGVFLTTMFSF